MKLFFLFISILLANSLTFEDIDLLQGPIQIANAVKAFNQLRQVLQKHELKFKKKYLNEVNINYLEDIDELSNYRYKTKCDSCDKNFKNSSFLLMHYYKYHLSADQISAFIQLNYFCSFIQCEIQSYQKTQNKTQIVIQNQIRMRQCLIFTHEYLEIDKSSISKMSEFCEDIISDQFNQEDSNLWSLIVEYFIYLAKIVFILAALYFEFKVLSYYQWLERKKTKNKSYSYPSQQEYDFNKFQELYEEDEEEEEDEQANEKGMDIAKRHLLT